MPGVAREVGALAAEDPWSAHLIALLCKLAITPYSFKRVMTRYLLLSRVSIATPSWHLISVQMRRVPRVYYLINL
jgi:hypothetical protein